MNRSAINRIGFAVFISITSACGLLGNSNKQKQTPPFVDSVEVQSQPKIEVSAKDQDVLTDADRELLRRNAEAASRKVTGELRLVKSAIFNQVFLYGADLQHSSFNDPSWGLYPQALAIGHVPCFFRQINNRLQLIADQSRLYESDINHPETMIAEYQIISETKDDITVNFQQGGIVLNHFMNGGDAPMPKQTWLRSIAFDAARNVLLQESAIMTASGVVQTFMESILPRNSLVPADYKPLEANPNMEPLADRYRFLGGEKVYVNREVDGHVDRVQTSFASRFLVEQNGHIDWYVTSNIPDRFIPAVKSGIEGWNRYFAQQLGRDVIRFMGVLPEGVKLGDPSYNIINWDTVADAGSAYESQAIDPMTGIQSHSLIYLPQAWYNYGVELWSKRLVGGDSLGKYAKRISKFLNPKSPEILIGRKNILACVRTGEEIAAPIQDFIKSSRLDSNLTVDEFGKRLVATVLFHEMGHALGLDHNFKASLSFDGSISVEDTNPVSFSSMDYNYYHLEMGFFDRLGRSEGPILEYDRQVISQLYNEGKDVKDSDLVIAACNDAEADDVVGGVDPTCLRYDAQKDPVAGLEQAWSNFANQTGAGGGEYQTLAEAFVSMNESIKEELKSFDSESNPRSGDEYALALADKVNLLTKYYLTSGAQSLARNLSVNAVQLRQWKSELITGVSQEQEERSRIHFGIVMHQSLELSELPLAPSKVLQVLADSLEQLVLAKSSLTLGDDERRAIARKSRELFLAKVKYEVEASLSRLRTSLQSSLNFDVNIAFALKYSASGALTRFEELALDALVKSSLKGLKSLVAGRRDQDLELFYDERMNAVKTLKTFHEEANTIDEVTQKLKAIATEAKASGDLPLLNVCRELLKQIGPARKW